MDIADILDVPLPQPPSTNEDEASLQTTDASTVKTNLDAYFQRLQTRTDLPAALTSFRTHLIALTGRYAPGLFHCYAIPGLPRTNNDADVIIGPNPSSVPCATALYRWPISCPTNAPRLWGLVALQDHSRRTPAT